MRKYLYHLINKKDKKIYTVFKDNWEYFVVDPNGRLSTFKSIEAIKTAIKQGGTAIVSDNDEPECSRLTPGQGGWEDGGKDTIRTQVR